MHYEKIQEKFNEVIKYSQNIENPNTDELFKKWYEAKKEFIEALDGKLIWEWPEKVSFELGPKEKNLRINDFIDMVVNNYGNNALAEFVEVEKEGFFSNQVIKSYKASNGAEIPKGMKLLKAFKFFEKDSKVLNSLQSAASMIIQEDKIEGTLCLSVHPLDYLSVSENNHNWRSCHALDGDYRSGNLSYMVDKTTIICYLKSNRSEKLPNFPDNIMWNSKKWRVLLFLSNNWEMLFAGRQYPFFTETGINFVKDKVLLAANLGQWSAWSDKKIRTFENEDVFFALKAPYVAVGMSLVPIDELIINEPGSLQFNDLLSSSCYDAMYAYRMVKSTWWDNKKMRPRVSPFEKFHVGGECKCLRCAKKPIELSETFMCVDCELQYGNSDSDIFATCPCCGNRFIFEDGYWIEGANETICEHCADEYTEVCGNCDERFYKEDMIYDREHEMFVCSWCAEIIDIKIDEEDCY